MCTAVKVIFPSLSKLPANPGVVYEIWEAMKQLPYSDRYDAYCEWKATVYDAAPELVLAKATASNATRKVLRRISKENTKQIGRGLAKVGTIRHILEGEHESKLLTSGASKLSNVASRVARGWFSRWRTATRLWCSTRSSASSRSTTT